MGTGIDIDFPGFHRLYDDGWILLFFFFNPWIDRCRNSGAARFRPRAAPVALCLTV
jgi:hypothetical protein